MANGSVVVVGGVVDVEVDVDGVDDVESDSEKSSPFFARTTGDDIFDRRNGAVVFDKLDLLLIKAEEGGMRRGGVTLLREGSKDDDDDENGIVLFCFDRSMKRNRF